VRPIIRCCKEVSVLETIVHPYFFGAMYPYDQIVDNLPLTVYDASVMNDPPIRHQQAAVLEKVRVLRNYHASLFRRPLLAVIMIDNMEYDYDLTLSCKRLSSSS
jgi:hypothetical protein